MIRGSRELSGNNLFLPLTNTNVRRSANLFEISQIYDENSKNPQAINVRNSIKSSQRASIQRASVLANNLFELLKKSGSSGNLLVRKKNSLFGDMVENKNQNNLEGLSQEQLLDIATLILEKPSKTRTQTDIKTLTKCTENVKFFQEMASNNEKEIHELCCKNMSVISMEKDDVVMEEGSYGSRFFIILNGSVDVFKNKVENSTPEKSPLRRMKTSVFNFNSQNTQNQNQNVGNAGIGLKSRLSIVTNDGSNAGILESPDSSPRKAKGGLSPDASPKKSRMSDRFSITWQLSALEEQNFEGSMATSKKTNISFKNRYLVKTLEAGSSFGELSLLENKPRQATIICKEACRFAILEKLHFKEILRDREQRKLFEQINFFASIKILKLLSYNTIKKIYYSSEELKLVKNEIVYKMNSVANEIYIIKTGKFKIMQILEEDVVEELDDLQATIMEEFHIHNPLSQPDQAEANPGNFQNLQKDIAAIQDSTGSSKFSKLPGSSPLKKQKPRLIELAIVGEGESFGEEEVITGDPRRTTVICESAIGVLYIVNKREFLKRMSTEHAARENITDQIKKRNEWRYNRLNDIKETNTKVPATPIPEASKFSMTMTMTRMESTSPIDSDEDDEKTPENISRKALLTKEKLKNDKRLDQMKDFLKKISGEIRGSLPKHKKAFSPLLLRAKKTNQAQNGSNQQTPRKILKPPKGNQLTNSLSDQLLSFNKQVAKHHSSASKDLDKGASMKPLSLSRMYQNFSLQQRTGSTTPSYYGKEKEDKRQNQEEEQMNGEIKLPIFKKLQLTESSLPYQLTSEGLPHTPTQSLKSNLGGYFFQSYNNGLKSKAAYQSAKLPLIPIMKDQRSKTDANIEKTLSLLEQSWRDSEESLGYPKIDLAKLGTTLIKNKCESSFKLQSLFETNTPRLREPKNFPGLFKGKPFRRMASNVSLSEDLKPEISGIALKSNRK